MIKALRVTLTGNLPYEKVEILNAQEQANLPFPNIFEDAQFVFRCKQGIFTLPDYNVRVIQLRTGKLAVPGATFVKRILLQDDLNYQNCYIIDSKDYARFGIPQIFREYEQLAFTCKDGVFIISDFQVRSMQVS